MANIAKLPNGRDLYATAKPLPGSAAPLSYGPHLFWYADITRDNAILATPSTVVLAVVNTLTGGAKVALKSRQLTPETVPYVNKFIAHTGRKVDLYWRTKEYRLVTIKGGKPRPITAPEPVLTDGSDAPSALDAAKAAVEPAVIKSVGIKPEPVAPRVTVTVETPEVEAEPEGVTIKAPRESHHGGDLDIPGLSIPPRVEVKNRGKGYVEVGDVVIEEAHWDTLDDAWEMAAAGQFSATLVVGPAGTAKTLLVQSFAAAKGIPFLKVDGGAIRTADDWAGAVRQDATTKTWTHRWSPFAQVLRAGQRAIVLIDEGNRTETPQALNSLLGLLDGTGTLLVPDANTQLTLPKGVLVVMTANIGPEFVGTLPIDGAVRQRFAHGIRLDYPTPEIEGAIVAKLTGVDKDTAGHLVKLAGLQRVNRNDPQLYPSGNVISTRTLVQIGERIVSRKRAPRAAVIATLDAQFDIGDKVALDVAIDMVFPAKAPKVEAATPDPTRPSWSVATTSCRALRTPSVCGYVTPGTGHPCGHDRPNPVHFSSPEREAHVTLRIFDDLFGDEGDDALDLDGVNDINSHNPYLKRAAREAFAPQAMDILDAVQTVVDVLTDPKGGRFRVALTDKVAASTQLQGRRRVVITSKPMLAGIGRSRAVQVMTGITAHEIGHILYTKPTAKAVAKAYEGTADL